MSETYEQTVSDIAPGLIFGGYLCVAASRIATTKNGKKFLDIRFTDKTGSIAAKLWDYSAETAPAIGTIMRVVGKGDEYNGHLQLKVDSMAPVDAGAFDPSEFVPTAPEPPEEMIAEIRGVVDSMGDKDLAALVASLIDKSCAAGLMLAPAAKTVHHAERGGLLHHTVTMLRVARSISSIYTNLNKSLLYAGIIVHDLAKLDEMQVDSLGIVGEYTTDGRLIGHITRGVVNIELAAKELGTPREKALLLEHIVLSHHGEKDFGSPVDPKIPEALVISAIDRLDAHLFVMFEKLASMKAGTFSDKLFALGNIEIYKPQM